jgi:predicted metal-dependent phosphoesterase TrpH
MINLRVFSIIKKYYGYVKMTKNNMDESNKVLFEKPNLEKLRGTYTLVDMHIHSRHSDGINKVSAIVKKAKKQRIGIAITDHNEIKGAIELDKYKGILTIPGIELTSKEGTHLLAYFYDIKELKDFYRKSVKPFLGHDTMSSLSLTMEELIKRAKKNKAVLILPHPYSAGFVGIKNQHFSETRIKNIFKTIDGIEAINSENLRRWNLKSALLAFNLGKAITGGSDGHTSYHIGKAITYAKCKNKRDDFLDAIRKGKTKAVGREIDILRKATATSFKLRRNLKNYPDLIEKNIYYSYVFLKNKKKSITKAIKAQLIR